MNPGHARMPVFLFVYGTLKDGFPNRHLNTGRRVGGRYRTVRPWPLHVVQLPHEDRAPWLLDAPGTGLQVRGEVFEVDETDLQAMDRFEEVGLPTGYVRVAIELEAIDAGPSRLQAHAYLKPPEQLRDCLAVEGPFDEYTLGLAQGYWLGVG
ncbi:gamma-glutamylcyclotransferase family protein [Leptothrix discophora]|uniref:Gamma-glutamylcyclotransferase family protein n=1 Tax=Leptothrix discophora TaxID=89 RepID=A0ABT9FYP8_LEPDI|nr:gamma-glutamylcyclotransferase family protein [Leptothrix discophora]MDP4299341.1 gamma-glutamylcyclotransferase family protein [Leptothrix discophora]